MTRIYQAIALFILSFSLIACATTAQLPARSQSELQQGKRLFETAYYKQAMKILLPLATDGVPDAQYAVGYMYYYGFGVATDTDTGYFWIKRAADQHFLPAQNALAVINKKPDPLKTIKY